MPFQTTSLRIWICCLLSFCLMPSILAQESPCQELKRNEICSAQGIVEIQGPNEIIIAEPPGSITPISNIRGARTRIERDTRPQSATFEVVTNGGSNLRGGPSTNHRIIGSLPGDSVIVASGRNRDGSWLYVVLEDGKTGWLSAPLVTSSGNIDMLDIIEADGNTISSARPEPSIAIMNTQGDFPQENPDHNLTLVLFGDTEIIDASKADEAPFQRLTAGANNSAGGIVLQTPERAGATTIAINNLNLQLVAATVYVDVTEDTIIHVLEGIAYLLTENDPMAIPAGGQLSANQLDEVTPYSAEIYASAIAGNFPVEFLPRKFEPASPNTPPPRLVVPLTGQWETSYGSGVLSCGDFRVEDNSLKDVTALLELRNSDNEDQLILSKSGNRDILGQPLRIASHIFRSEGEILSEEPLVISSIDLWMLSSREIQGIQVAEFENGCRSFIPFAMRFAG